MAKVGMDRTRRNLRSDIVSAAMSSRSSASASLPASHRFDLLITEQRSLVYSAQQALQQSLSVLQGSSAKSKEEQESVQFQVQTVLDRAQELIVRLQVVDKIRNELGYIQQRLTEAKKAHRNVDDLHARLRWLEQRLEGLLLARRRGRPAAHGKRAVHATRTQGRGLLPVMEPTPRSVPESGSLDNRFEGLSDRYTNTKSTSVYQSQGLSQTITRSVSQDSDVWHSESEANWTMVHTTKDITQSQVLSDDDKTEVAPDSPRLKNPGHHSQERSGVESMNKEEKDHHHVVIGGDSTEENFTEENIFGFEPQRSSQIFGHNSWNTLTLAVNSNYFAAGSNESASAGMLNLSSLQTGLDRLCSEIDSLKVLLQAASRAAAQPGPLLTVKNQDRVGSFKRPRSRSEPLKLTLNTSLGRQTLVRFPSIEVVASDCSKLHPSHRLYGQKSNSYPRSAGAWTSNQVLNKAQSDSTSDVSLSQSMGYDVLSPQWRRQRLKSTRSQSSRRKSARKTDIFDVEGHRQRCVEHLCKQLKSTALETRIDSVQALGLLKDGTEEVTDSLLCVLTQDTKFRVKYEAVKSLLLLGVFNETMLHFVYSCLKLGSTNVQTDLLKLLSQDNVLCLLIQETEPSMRLLQDVLTELLSNDDLEVSLYSAVVLSHLDQQQDEYTKKLYEVLETSNQQHQSMALHCLIKCCGCCDDDVISSALNQMAMLSNWKLRLSAVEDLKYIGKDLLNYQDEKGQDVFNVLLKMIIREPIRAVRVALGQLLSSVGLARKAESVLYGRLASSKEITRGEAVAALGSFEGLQLKTIQTLLECLELDPSSYVRVQVVRTLAQMKIYNQSVVKCIAEKSRGHDMLARECAVALQSLEKRFGLA